MSKSVNKLIKRRVNEFGGYYANFSLLINLFGKEKIVRFNNEISELNEKYEDMLNINPLVKKVGELQVITTEHNNKTNIQESNFIKEIRKEVSEITQVLAKLRERQNDLVSIEAAQLYIDYFN